MTDLIEVVQDGRGVATLSLARPEKHNALSAEMLTQLEAAARDLAAQEGVRVVVLAARGESFCAGGDLAWMRAQFAMPSAQRQIESARIASALQAIYEIPHPVIGRVQGNAFGGGLGLMSVCDLCVSTQTACFGFTETRLGLIPANIGPYVIARMGAAAAQQVFMNARLFGADEAHRFNLLARVVPAEALDSALEEEIAPYMSCAPGAVRESKALLRHLSGTVAPDQVTHAIGALARRWETDEAQAGIAAFFARETPPWQT